MRVFPTLLTCKCSQITEQGVFFLIDLFIAKSVNELTVRHVIYPKVYDCTAVDCIYQSE